MKTVDKDRSRTMRINRLRDYIVKMNKNNDKNDINKSLLLQFCRFSVISEEISKEIKENIDKMSDDDLQKRLQTYKVMNGIVLNLYKTLDLKNISEECENEENPYLALMKEAAKDDAGV